VVAAADLFSVTPLPPTADLFYAMGRVRSGCHSGVYWYKDMRPEVSVVDLIHEVLVKLPDAPPSTIVAAVLSRLDQNPDLKQRMLEREVLRIMIAIVHTRYR
jgi:hypothetical protein